jgi:hypothetical protein
LTGSALRRAEFALATCLGLTLCFGLASCERDAKPNRAASEPSAPWLAEPPPSATPSARPLDYRLTERSRIVFDLSTKQHTIRGVFPVVDGRFEVDAADVSRTRGTARIDLGAVRLEADGGSDAARSNEARNWLNIGSSRPEAERERLRFAHFDIEAVDDVSPSARREPRDAGAGDVQRFTFDARGTLRFQDRRATQTLAVAASFHYATPGATRPQSITVTTTEPLRLDLAAFGIAPRNAHGVLLASELELLGKDVAGRAKVDLDLELEPAPK